MEKRSFYAPDIDPSIIGQAVFDWFEGQNYQTQMLPSQNGAITVQAHKEDALRTLAGMSTAQTLIIVSDGDNLNIEMGTAKWTDKAVVGGVGVLLFPPALITAGIGVFQQSQLTSNAWKFIENYIQTQSAFGGRRAAGAQSPYPQPLSYPSQTPRPPAAPPPPINYSAAGTAGAAPTGTPVCTSCKQPLRQGAKFCDNCGAPVPTSNLCKSCGKTLRPGAKFCDNCGSPVG